MTATRLSSEGGPAVLLGDPETAWLAVRIVTRVEAMGLLDVGVHRTMSEPAFIEALHALEAAGLARRQVQAALRHPPDPGLLRTIDIALTGSPLPEREWPAMTAVLKEDLLHRLVGASATSVGRYRRDDRPTPDSVAARLHFIVLIVADLAGSYNARGVRRWFSRPRPQLAGQAPRELLVRDWDPDDPGPQQVAALAASLIGAAGAT
ncbi:MAG: hypothetical protein M3063_06310 [Actinomycetota bacterium]|nr:hypothetical protein [Actinomycetota bacterium]MDQ6948645.1 hypothetical protein [Actinomycetota bacterium]